MIENKPELLATFFGLNKVHAVSAFINVNLKGKPLLHSFATSKANYFLIGKEREIPLPFLPAVSEQITGAEHIQQVIEARSDIDGHHFLEDEVSNLKVFAHLFFLSFLPHISIQRGNWFSLGTSARGFTYLDPILANQSPVLNFPLYAKRSPLDAACYIYTRFVENRKKKRKERKGNFC
jgi:hypothetical protein